MNLWKKSYLFKNVVISLLVAWLAMSVVLFKFGWNFATILFVMFFVLFTFIGGIFVGEEKELLKSKK